MYMHVYVCVGELQSILCAAFTATGEVYTGTLSGDIYKWKGHHLHSVIKAAHKASSLYVHVNPVCVCVYVWEGGSAC